MSKQSTLPLADLGPTGPGGIKRGKSALVQIAKKARPFFNRLMTPYSLVGNSPITDARIFPWYEELEKAFPAIQAEADRILRFREAVPPFRDFAPGHEKIAPHEDDWRSFFFWGYGYPVERNINRCPETSAAVVKIPGLVSALYSVVSPGAHIRRHKGVTKAIMTLHLCLRAPSEAEKCRLEAGGIEVVFREGRAVVLDDTFPHEVWNDSDETRVNLLIQFRRPMRQPGRAIASIVVWLVRHSSFVQKARRNLDYWEEAYAAAERA